MLAESRRPVQDEGHCDRGGLQFTSNDHGRQELLPGELLYRRRDGQYADGTSWLRSTDHVCERDQYFRSIGAVQSRQALCHQAQGPERRYQGRAELRRAGLQGCTTASTPDTTSGDHGIGKAKWQDSGQQGQHAYVDQVRQEGWLQGLWYSHREGQVVRARQVLQDNQGPALHQKACAQGRGQGLLRRRFDSDHSKPLRPQVWFTQVHRLNRNRKRSIQVAWGQISLHATTLNSSLFIDII